MKACTSLADDVYEKVKAMAITFQVRPGERLGEVELAERFGVSRTPVREALNRLVKEDLLTFTRNRGFQCRPLDAKEIFDLYELRLTLEVAAVRLAAERAKPEELGALADFLAESRAVPEDTPVVDLVALDERFHEGVARLSRNLELLKTLVNINARIRFVRWIDMENGRRLVTQDEHLRILRALQRRDAEGCAALTTRHIGRRLDQIVDVIREGFVRIYMVNIADQVGPEVSRWKRPPPVDERRK